MAISNTNILIKRSSTTGRPTSLAAGEFGYSYQSNTLYFGSPAGTGVINVGGQYYTTTLDAATSANTAGTLVRRDSNNNFYGGLYGNANTATALLNSRNFSITGGDITASAVGFDGTGAVALNASLNSVAGLSSGVYGGTTAIPVITMAANGRVMAIANTTIATSFTVSGNTGSGTQSGGGTLTIQGGNTGIFTTVTGSAGSETVRIDTDATVLRSNTSSVGSQIIQSNLTVGQDLTIQGNLTVLGSQTTINTSSIVLNDPLLFLANNNYTSDAVDIGIVGHYNDVANAHTGIIRDSNLKEWLFFQGYTPEIYANNNINIADPSFAYANVYALNFKGNVIATRATVGSLTLTNALTVPNGGTGATTLGAGQILIGNGTGAVTAIANVGTAGTYANAAYVPVITTDAYGRVTGVTNTAIVIDTSAITTGTLGVPRGGTGASTFTSGAILIGSGSGALSTLSNTTFTATGTGAQNNTITSVTVDSYGRLTAATYSAISGLTVGQGGTGVATFTTNGITYGNGTGPLQVTAAAGTADQTWSNQILTTTNAGVPIWSSALDGGQF